MSSPHDLTVLHYWPRALGLGGVEKHIQCLVSAQVELGCDARVVANTKTFSNLRSRVVVHTHAQDAPPSLSLPGSMNVHTLHGTSLGRALACREYLSLAALKASYREMNAARKSHGLICVSQDVRSEARRYFFLPRKLPCVVISGGTPAEFISQGSFPGARLPSKPFALFVGRGRDRVKNVETIISAWRHGLQSCAEMPNLLAVPGEGFEMADDLIKAGLLETTGFLQSDALSVLMQKASCIVAPSFYESDGLVFWEAMALGIPVVTNPRLAQRLNAIGYGSAYGVDPRSAASLMQTVQKCVQTTIRATPIIRPWSKVAAEVLDFYGKLL